jgi:hypothetical protein
VCLANNHLIKVATFWVVTPCSLMVAHQRFGDLAAYIFRVEIRARGDIPTAVFPIQRYSWCVIGGFYGSRVFLCCCAVYISSITNFKPEDGGSKASETLVSNHQTTLHNNPENHDFYIPAGKPWKIPPNYLTNQRTNTHLHLVSRSKNAWSYTSTPTTP